jgi:F0F1-type ATP synthase assembly protein I
VGKVQNNPLKIEQNALYCRQAKPLYLEGFCFDMIQKTPQNDRQWWVKPLEIFLRISVWIAIPVIGALFLGKFLDKKLGTDPWMFLGLTGIAFILSCIGIVRETQTYLTEIEKEHGHNNDSTTK